MNYNIEIIEKYFPDTLTDVQRDQFTAMGEIYAFWNSQINVISRKDIDNIYLHHILHSLSIIKVLNFPAGSVVMDIGCGGGFPGIPLAVMFPDVQFKLIDSIGKKITVVREVCKALGINNVEAYNCRAEELNIQTDFVVSRAVTDLAEFMKWSWKKIRGGDGKGLIYLKGGDLTQEIEEGLKGNKKILDVELFDISKFFEEEFFDTKKILYIKKGNI